MKLIHSSASLFIAGLLLACFSLTTNAAAATGTINVHIAGIQNTQGNIKLALYNSAQAFANKQNARAAAYKKGATSIKKDLTATYQFKNVPYGNYAIKLFHDEKMTGKLARSFVGRPQEGFGFSNNPKVTNKAPSFEQAQFKVNKNNMTITIHMIHP